eukprot:CAMPEP_0198703752 /NCGR_PEP_ID=MMETSP1468-20131203/389521_1 /TAXON_ID=1461545 /ORGANISM="Mantoniella sp, Strain CCMP1436" /LENGTH=67 /DNA_ID=CAMNT_0044462495 /DNA_START=1585 /DNA_END=1784 /DNA_ORIENTATION=+
MRPRCLRLKRTLRLSSPAKSKKDASQSTTGRLEDTQGDGLVDGHGRADAHPDGVEGADEEHGGGDGA